MGSWNWEAIAVALAIVAAWSGLLISVIRWFLSQYFKRIEASFNDVKDSIEKNTKDVHRIDIDIANLRTNMHAEFVRREDAIRQEVVVGAKLDALAAKIDTLNERTATRGS